MTRPTPLAAWELLPAAALCAAFYALTLPQWSDELLWGPDTDKIFANVHLLLDHHTLPGLGNGILPTRLRLGSAYFYLVSLLYQLAGRDLWTTWLLLTTTNLAALLGATVVLRRWLPPLPAWAFGATLAADPLMYAEQGFHPFWYQHYSLWLMLPVLLGCLGTLLEGRLVWWYLACAAAGLAAQYHAMLWTLLPCGLLVAVHRRHTLGALQVAGGVAAFVLCCLPMVSQVPLLYDPNNWVTMVTDHTDPAVRFSGFEAIARFFRTLHGRVTGGLLTLTLGALALLRFAWRAPDASSPWQPLAQLTLTWTAAIALVFYVVSHRLHIHYGYLTIVPSAVAVAALCSLLPARLHGATVATLAVLAALLPRAIWPPDIEYSVPPDAPWAYHDLVIGTFERLDHELGASLQDVYGPRRRVHGLPCGWTGSRICPHELPKHLLHGAGMTGDQHVTVRLDPTRGALLEPWTPCVQVEPSPTALRLRGACDDAEPPAVALVVLHAPPGDDPPALLHPDDTTLWQVLAAITHHPDRTRTLVLQTHAAHPWPAEQQLSLHLPAGYALDDVFFAPEPWTRAALGVDPTGPLRP